MSRERADLDPVDALIDRGDVTLLDVIDHVLNKGVVLTADIVLGLADVDLVRLRLWLVLAAADRFLPDGATPE